MTDGRGAFLSRTGSMGAQQTLMSCARSRCISRWELHYLLDKLTIGEVMARTVVTVIPDCPVSEAVSHLLHHKIGALPVLEERHIVGIVTRTDILRAFLSNVCGCHVDHD